MATQEKNATASDTDKDSATAGKNRRQDGTRETVESIAIAFILAFLFKTFQAEAYVIPTGSMAPTLYGRHKDVHCEACGFHFALGASSEIDQDSGTLQWRIRTAYCANCGYENEVSDAPVFNGDRILVNKQYSNFRRFDVVVFKNPEQGHVNYIKRCVGLPGETVRVRKGDLWVKAKGSDSFEIQRKHPDVQRDIQLTVYDDRFPPMALLEKGWPERWGPAPAGSGTAESGDDWSAADNKWSIDRDARVYRCDATDGSEQTLRYRHFHSDASVWNHLTAAALPAPEATLIADLCSFNAYAPEYRQGVYWVGDLTLNATVDIQQAAEEGTLTLKLTESPRVFQCAINLSTGEARLFRSDVSEPNDAELLATAATSIKQSGTYRISFANVDDRVCLWVDDEYVPFDGTTEYTSSELPHPTDDDLSPVAVTVSQAKIELSDLLLQRDIYYRNDIVAYDQQDGIAGTSGFGNALIQEEVRHKFELQRLLNSPSNWAAYYAQESTAQLQQAGRYGDYALADDEYLMFGDNSSMSKDSRLFDYDARPFFGIFSHRYAVRQQDLIGKAVYIFWPHGIPFMNDGKGYAVWYHKGRNPNDDADEYPSVRVPFYPNIARMKKIR